MLIPILFLICSIMCMLYVGLRVWTKYKDNTGLLLLVVAFSMVILPTLLRESSVDYHSRSMLINKDPNFPRIAEYKELPDGTSIIEMKPNPNFKGYPF